MRIFQNKLNLWLVVLGVILLITGGYKLAIRPQADAPTCQQVNGQNIVPTMSVTKTITDDSLNLNAGDLVEFVTTSDQDGVVSVATTNGIIFGPKSSRVEANTPWRWYVTPSKSGELIFSAVIDNSCGRAVSEAVQKVEVE